MYLSCAHFEVLASTCNPTGSWFPNVLKECCCTVVLYIWKIHANQGQRLFKGYWTILKSNVTYQMKTIKSESHDINVHKMQHIFELPEKKQECLIYKTNKLNVGFIWSTWAISLVALLNLFFETG